MTGWWALDAIDRRAELEVVGHIGDDGQALAQRILALDVDEIAVRIDSPGGSEMALLAAWALAGRTATCQIGRHADSAALLLALGARHRTCHPAATMVVHAGQPPEGRPAGDLERSDRRVAAWLALRTTPAEASPDDRASNAAWWLDVMHEDGGKGRTFDAWEALHYHLVHDVVVDGWTAPGPLDEIVAGVAEPPAGLGDMLRGAVEAQVAQLVTTR